MLALFCLLVGLATALYVGAPLVSRSPSWTFEDADDDLDELCERREILLAELRDIEFDHRMNKIDAAEYAEMQADTNARAAEVLRELDSINDRLGQGDANDGAILELEAEAEVLIARARRRLRQWNCPQCGRGMPAADNFCASCGTAKRASAG